MKCRLGQVLKRVTAIGMAVWMIFLPLNVKISKVYGGQASTDINNVVRIMFDSYILSDFSVTEVGEKDAEAGSLVVDNNIKAMLYTDLEKDKSYTISVNWIRDLDIYKDI